MKLTLFLLAITLILLGLEAQLELLGHTNLGRCISMVTVLVVFFICGSAIRLANGGGE